jgi:hypothetical protein
MIEIEILSSDDFFSLGKYTFNKNLIYIGKNSYDLHINEPSIVEQHLMLEVLPDMILVHLNSLVDNFYVNGKIIKKIKPIKIGDEITIANSKLKLTNAKYIELESIDELKNKNLNILLNKNHQLHDFFLELSKKVKNS